MLQNINAEEWIARLWNANNNPVCSYASRVNASTEHAMLLRDGLGRVRKLVRIVAVISYLQYSYANELAAMANIYTRHLKAVIVSSPCTTKCFFLDEKFWLRR